MARHETVKCDSHSEALREVSRIWSVYPKARITISCVFEQTDGGNRVVGETFSPEDGAQIVFSFIYDTNSDFPILVSHESSVERL